MENELIALLEKALSMKASDIHFKLEQEEVEIQFRTRQQVITISDQGNDVRLFRYLQYRANLDVSNIIKPQTGQFEVEIKQKKYSLRFATLHSLSVISGVLRILNADFHMEINELTFEKKQIEQLKKLLIRRNGLILISGPTGSGKTTTLYTLLDKVKDRKIFTLEDPIEVYSHRYVQLQINEKQNLDYQEGIKQLLRHDPDIIVLGEIRDEVAAKMAVRCALTGHLVISTLHASNCFGAIERMLELNVPARQLKDVLMTVTNQRLYSIKGKHGKVGVYEIMQRAQLLDAMEQRPLEEFSTLQQQIEIGIKKGILSARQTQYDRVE